MRGAIFSISTVADAVSTSVIGAVLHASLFRAVGTAAAIGTAFSGGWHGSELVSELVSELRGATCSDGYKGFCTCVAGRIGPRSERGSGRKRVSCFI
jgi:hypothetical protein